MKNLLFILIIIFQVSLSQKKIVDNPIDDKIANIDSTDTEYVTSLLIVKIVLDFNNDGIKDIAVANTDAWGNAGGNWNIYLGRKDGKFENIGEIFFHPLAFKVIPQKTGNSKMIIYHRMGGDDGDMVEYSVAENGINETKRRIMKPDDENTEDYNNYWQLFGDLYKKPKSTCCRLIDYLKDKNCKWYPGCYIENK